MGGIILSIKENNKSTGISQGEMESSTLPIVPLDFSFPSVDLIATGPFQESPRKKA